MSSAVLAWARLTTSGGDIRTVVSPHSSTSRPFSNEPCCAASACSAVRNSTPIISPIPRTSVTTPGNRSGSSASAPSRKSPTSVEWASSPSSLIVASVASPAAHGTGLPPYVEPCEPAPHFSISSARATNPPSGRPEASPLAVISTSGSTPMCSIAHILPVRPIPDWTSSATSRIPCRSQSSRSRTTHSAGGTM